MLLLNPGFYVNSDDVSPDGGADFLSRRASPMLWVSGNASIGLARDVIRLGMATMWGGIALTGIYAFFMGVASTKITFAAMFEALFAMAFLVSRSR